MEGERRKDPRISPPQHLELETDRRLRVEVLDVSPSGLKILTDGPLRPGTQLRFLVPGTGDRISATVRRCRAVQRDGRGLCYESGLELAVAQERLLAVLTGWGPPRVAGLDYS